MQLPLGDLDQESAQAADITQREFFYSCTPEAECGIIDIIKEVILFGFLFGGLYTLFTIG